jgi:hypothetical protein
LADVCLGKPFQPERKLVYDIQNIAKAPATISKLDRYCNEDNKNRPAIATRTNSLSSPLLEKIGFPTKQWFADNLRHLPLPPVTPGIKVESSAYPGHLLMKAANLGDEIHIDPPAILGNDSRYLLNDLADPIRLEEIQKKMGDHPVVKRSWSRRF